LEHDEEERLLTASSPEMQSIIRLALETAMRREEISSLLWCNINLESRKATLLDTKNTTQKIDRNSRTIPLLPKALEIISALRQARQNHEPGTDKRRLPAGHRAG